MRKDHDRGNRSDRHGDSDWLCIPTLTIMTTPKEYHHLNICWNSIRFHPGRSKAKSSARQARPTATRKPTSLNYSSDNSEAKPRRSAGQGTSGSQGEPVYPGSMKMTPTDELSTVMIQGECRMSSPRDTTILDESTGRGVNRVLFTKHSLSERSNLPHGSHHQRKRHGESIDRDG